MLDESGNLVGNTSDIDAIHYRNHSQLQYQSALKLMESHSFKETDHLLDVGCGDGKITAELAKKMNKGKVVGVDLSPAMINLAKSSFQNNDYPNLTFQLGDAADLKFSNQFNQVISVNCLHWVKDMKKALSGLIEALVPGGFLLLLLWPKDPAKLNPLEEAKREDSRWKEYTGEQNNSFNLTPDDYKHLLTQFQVDILNFQVDDHVAIFGNKAELRAFIKIWANYYFPLPSELQEEYLDEVVERALAQSCKKEDNIQLSLKFLIIKLKKRL